MTCLVPRYHSVTSRRGATGLLSTGLTRHHSLSFQPSRPSGTCSPANTGNVFAVPVAPEESRRNYMKHPTSRLFTTAACLIFLPGIGLTAISMQAQTFAYVTNPSYDAVAVLNTANNSVTAFVGVGSAPFAVAITPDGSRAYVTNQDSNSVSVIETANKKVTATTEVERYPTGVAITPDGRRAYLANTGSN